MRFLRSEGNRGELTMTQGDRRLQWMVMFLEASSPLIVGESLFLLDAVPVLAVGVILTAGFVALRVQDRISHTPSKVVVDPEGLTRELFWTGRTEHLLFSEVTQVKRFEYWAQTKAQYRIESATGIRWTFTSDGPTKHLDQCFEFIDELLARSKEGG